MPDPQPPAGPLTRPPLPTCPDCGGILEPTNPAWQSLVQSFQAHTPRGAPASGSRWQCLICGYLKP